MSCRMFEREQICQAGSPILVILFVTERNDFEFLKICFLRLQNNNKNSKPLKHS